MKNCNDAWDYICEQNNAGVPRSVPSHLEIPEFLRQTKLASTVQILVREILRPWCITISKDEIYGAVFDLHPSPKTAHPRAWCWVLAVRGGALVSMCEERQRLRAEKPMPETGALRAYAYHALSQMIDRYTQDFCYAARVEAFMGTDICELVALSPDLQRVLGRYTGLAAVAGHPQCYLGALETPVRIYQTVRSWLQNLCEGVVQIGTDDDLYDYLAGAQKGIITDNLSHGRAIKKLLTKPYEIPPIMVHA